MTGRTEALKPQDVFVACQLAIWEGDKWTYAELAERLHLSTSGVFEALGRCRQAKLVATTNQGARVVGQRLFDYLVHGVPTTFYPRKIEVVRGIPTSIYSPIYRDRFARNDKELPVVWPYSKGKEMGEGLLPLYPTIPIACSQNAGLYNLMATVDVLRIGKSRERDAAVSYLESILGVDEPEQASGTNEKLA
jgi:hypothetical protein